MRDLSPQKVFAQYREPMRPDHPVMGRKYTITHSDTTAELFVFMADDYAQDQVTRMRDEVRIAWEPAEKGVFLLGSVVVEGKGVMGSPQIRNAIFLKEMPTALQAMRQADRFLFDKYPSLDGAQVLIHFVSSNPTYDKTYDFGAIGSYK